MSSDNNTVTFSQMKRKSTFSDEQSENDTAVAAAAKRTAKNKKQSTGVLIPKRDCCASTFIFLNSAEVMWVSWLLAPPLGLNSVKGT